MINRSLCENKEGKAGRTEEIKNEFYLYSLKKEFSKVNLTYVSSVVSCFCLLKKEHGQFSLHLRDLKEPHMDTFFHFHFLDFKVNISFRNKSTGVDINALTTSA